ncbi:MAG TPA: DMT family transporter [Dongiaceae bacterium]|jgi:drug/metabolite transporter (DMT)-like permease|nr:DMT family transporter [Dongiaceae bacterium]
MSLAATERAELTRVDKGALRTAIGGVFISGLGPLLVRNSPVDSAATAFWRLMIALPAALWLARRVDPLPPRAKALAILAGLLLAGDLVLWNRAIVSTTILEATLLVMIYPLLVALGGFLIWRERITKWLGIGGILAFAGLVVMTLGPVSGQSSVSGNLYAVAAAVFYSGCMLITGRLCRAYPTIAVTAWSFVGAALGSLPAALFEDRVLAVDLFGWAYLALYGALTLAGYLLINRSLGKLPTALVAVLGYGQPVVATSLAIPLLGEVPALGDLAGAIVVVAGLVLATRPAKPVAAG